MLRSQAKHGKEKPLPYGRGSDGISMLRRQAKHGEETTLPYGRGSDKTSEAMPSEEGQFQ